MKIIFVLIFISLFVIGCSSSPIRIPYSYSGKPNLTLTMNVERGFLTGHDTYVEIFKETKACEQYDTMGMAKLSGDEEDFPIPTSHTLLIRVTYVESGRWQNATREDQFLFKPLAGEHYHLVYTNRDGLNGLEMFRGRKRIEGKPQDCLFQPRRRG